MPETIKAIVGAGILPAFIASAFGAPEGLQFLLFLFGATYGGMWITHCEH
jgi:hypothetical protein